MRHVSKVIASSVRLRSTSLATQASSILQLAVYKFPSFQNSLYRRCYSSSDTMSTKSSSSQVERSGLKGTPDPRAEADIPGDSRRSNNKKGRPKKKDTHFLCFPLVTDESIPQLAKSLQYFRHVTTKPGRTRDNVQGSSKNPDRSEDEVEGESQPHASETSERAASEPQPNTNLSQSLPLVNQDLQILPAIAHRPPGTFHLTLGVMDLSSKEEMDRALNLLQEIDYADVFLKVLAHTDDSHHQQRQHHNDPPATNPPDETDSKLVSLNRPVSPPHTSSTSTGQPPEFSKVNPPQLSLTGLSTFPAAKTSRVFFAKPSPSPSTPFPLLKFGQAIRRKFREAGFITETRPLVLHATLANMRYAVQARGGRTSKGKDWRYGKDRWKDGQVDARELIKCFDNHEGNVEEYVKGTSSAEDAAREYVWARDIVLNRVAICKMGAEKSDDDVLGMVYPPIGEKMIFS